MIVPVTSCSHLQSHAHYKLTITTLTSPFTLANAPTNTTSYPMPTVALINGHGFAGGLMTAMYHDYRVFNPSKGFICLNELEFGAPLKPPMSSIFRQKVTPAVYRSLVLEAHRFPGPQARDAGLVDALGGLPEVLQLVRERHLLKKGTTGVYGQLKAEMYRETMGYLSRAGFDADEASYERFMNEEDARKEEGSKRAEETKSAARAKL